MIIHAECGKPLVIGIGGEDQVTAVTFDISAWVEAYGPGSVQLVHRRSVDPDATPVPVTFADGVVTWPITAADTAYQGVGEAQLIYTPQNRTKKSAIFQTVVDRALTSPAEVPIPLRGWVQQVMETAEATVEETEELAAAAAASAAEAAESARHLTIDDTLTYEGQAADAAAVRSALLYVPMEISSFSITAPSDGKAELGSTVTAVTLSYALNQVPDTLTLDVETPVPDPGDSGEIELTGQSITKDSEKKTWTLTAEDSGSPIHEAASATKTATLHFYNRVYWGTAAIPGSGVDDDFVTGLGTSALTDDTRRKVNSLNSTGGKYIWYAVPHSINSRGCKFKVAPSDFFSEFTLYSDVYVTNESWFQEKYDVYRSTNPDLGNTSMEVAYLN